MTKKAEWIGWFWNTAYDSSVGGVVKQNEVAKHCGEAEQPEAGNEDDDGVLEVELGGLTVDHNQELEAVRLHQGSTVLLVVLSVTKVPAEIIQNPIFIIISVLEFSIKFWRNFVTKTFNKTFYQQLGVFWSLPWYFLMFYL